LHTVFVLKGLDHTKKHRRSLILKEGQRMKKSLLVAAGLLASGLLASTAGAAPLGGLGTSGASTDSGLVQKVTGTHRACAHDSRGWHYHSRFIHRRISCRPARPGALWIWRSEGGRVGWWHPRERRWHE
jgi:hypothetical protein